MNDYAVVFQSWRGERVKHPVGIQGGGLQKTGVITAKMGVTRGIGHLSKLQFAD